MLRPPNSAPESGPTLLTAREIALAAGCSPRTARRAIRRELGSGLTTFGAERWPEPLVREALLRNILRRNGNTPADDG
jgi:hypothetical protein